MTSTDGSDSAPDVPDRLLAHQCSNGHLTYPAHPRCPTCGEPQERTVDLTEMTGTVVTWTRVTVTPPGVHEPNLLAIVEFELEMDSVRILGGTTGAVETGDEVRPVYVEQLRDPGTSVREGTGQRWDGFRFEPVTRPE